MEDNNDHIIEVVQLTSEYVAPKAVESDESEWIEIGDNDEYFSYVDDCYENSPTNNAIINWFADQIYGKGIEATDGARNPEAYIALKKLCRPREFKRMAADLARYGSFSALYIMEKGNQEKVAEIVHIPRRNVRPQKCDDKGRIMKYGVDWNWEEVRENKCEPQAVYDNLEELEKGQKVKSALMVFSPYSPSHFYFNPVPYQGALKYAEIEWRLASFRLNLIRKGFTGTTVVNFNNGVPDSKKERQRIINEIKAKFTAEYNDEPDQIIVTFNADKEHALSFESVPINDAATQYEEVSKEASQKIIVGHRVTSPMLVGIKQDVGLGNNADEIKTAYTLMDNTVLLPKKEMLLEAAEVALNRNGHTLDLYVKTLAPIEFTEVDQVQDTAEVEKETGVQMSSHVTPEYLDELAEHLTGIGETEDQLLEEFELYDTAWADDEDVEARLEDYLNKEFTNLSADQESAVDTGVFKVRYMYKETANKPVKLDANRPLCSKLMAAQLLYRKEDIVALSSKGGAEDQGQPYNVFLYKGGVNCRHGWERRIYRKRLKKNGEPWGGGAMNGVERSTLSAAIRAGVKINRKQDTKAFIAPRDTPTKGHK